MDIKTTILVPNDFDDQQISKFIALVNTGGEVSNLTEAKVRTAKYLAMTSIDGPLACVGALKLPENSYRNYVKTQSGFDLSCEHFPLELGWLVTDENFRRQGLARFVASGLVNKAQKGAFATTRLTNRHMHNMLQALGFHVEGNSYPSKRTPGEWLHLYIRPSQTKSK